MEEEKSCKYCGSLFRRKNLPKYLWDKKKYCNRDCLNKAKYERNKEKYIERAKNRYRNNKKEENEKRWKRMHKRLKKDKEFRKKRNARWWAEHNVKLKEKICVGCGIGKNLTRHHPDYNQPKKVKILCEECHHDLHNS